MQKNLPRPTYINISELLANVDLDSESPEALIAKEAAALMANDAVKYPVDGIKVAGKAPTLQTLSDDALAEAGLQIMLETKPIPSLQVIQDTFDSRNKNAILLGLGCYDDDDEEEKVAAVTSAFDVSFFSLDLFIFFQINFRDATNHRHLIRTSKTRSKRPPNATPRSRRN